MSKKILKILSFNFLVFLTSILVIEAIFGGWFKKNNMGAYFREHRMKKVQYSTNYDNKIFEFIYRRNYHGFIGDEINPKDIKYIFVGGSTADERWKPKEYSISEQLNKKFDKDFVDLKIINAAIEGQTTIGYIASFKFWFSKLKDFKPKYFIFYIGLNDILREDFNTWDYSDGMAKIVEPKKIDYFFDNLKSRSIFYDLVRKTKHKYYLKEKKNFIDIDASVKKYLDNDYSKKIFKNRKYEYLNFNQAYKKNNLNKILKKESKLINFYLNNIDEIVRYSNDLGAKPIFINQTTAYGGHLTKHVALNYSFKNHCKKKKYTCIDIAGNLKGKPEYWYDGFHTTHLGSKVIANSIYPELKDLLK